ncbi:TolB family protein [Thermocatellispora tengchongensis]|uniref:TolB family protein n=1 Tax=Thermocatellispora tengchongensis TaxID=1073253 RepID=UPI0036296A94
MPRLSPGDLYRLAVPGDPRLRPDGGAVAYVLTTADREADENRSEIWLAAPGAEPRRLTTGPRDAAPRWAPDGRTLAFLREVDGRPQVHLLPMDGGMDGGEPWALTSAPLGAGVPVWSPDGRTIAYAAPCGEVDPHAPVVADALDYKADGAGLLRGLRTHLFSCDVATGETTRLTEGDFHAGEPSWSADGRRLAFVADMRPDRDLKPGAAVYEVAAAGGGPVRLTGEDVVCAAAWWLDGRLVVAGWAGGDLVSHTRLFRLEAGGLEEIAPELDRNVMTGAPATPGRRRSRWTAGCCSAPATAAAPTCTWTGRSSWAATGWSAA